MKSEDFAGREPRLRLEDYFQGRCRAWGLFHDRFGTLRRQFEAETEGTWDGRTLTLVEDFTYHDGGTERRTWRISPVGENGYRGEANDVVGAAEGAVHGHVLNWSYDFALRAGGRVWTVRFDDWMFLQRDGILINRAQATKLGLGIGQLTCVFRKLSDG